jgi:2-polyprenyl-6-methoxyphenol hydroxylase-like FAD-dependent oxidoreductase
VKAKNDVLVVGGGPVGLFSALCLAERGIGVRVFDSQWQGAVHSRALALHPESLRLFDELGVANLILPQGHRIERVAYYEDDKRQAEVDVTKVGGTFPFVLVVSQSLLETALERALSERGVKVQRNHQVQRLEARDGSVAVEVARLEKASVGYGVMHTEWEIDKIFELDTPFVIGADGRESSVRPTVTESETLGPTDRFAVFEFAAPLDVQNEVRVALSDNSSNVLWPLAPGRGRWTFQRTEPALPDKPEEQILWGFVQARAPWFRTRQLEVEWSARVHFDRRLVSRMGQGRRWLAGDAAHSTNPIGVQSMNVGLREAHDLAARVSAILHGGASMSVLDEYDAKWRGDFKRLIASEVQFESGTEPWLGRHASRLVSTLPASGSDLVRLLGQLRMKLA